MMMRKRQALVTFCCNLSFCAFSQKSQKKTHTKNTKAFTIE